MQNHYQTKLKELQRKHELKLKTTTNKTTTARNPPTSPTPSSLNNAPQSNNNNMTNATSTSIPTSPPVPSRKDIERDARIRHLETELQAKSEEIWHLNQQLSEKRKGFFLNMKAFLLLWY